MPILALIVALGIQIGTNYVNDYADGVRGTDEHRVGPVRLVAGKLATVREVKIAALIAFGVAALAGPGPGRPRDVVAHPDRPRVRHRGMGATPEARGPTATSVSASSSSLSSSVSWPRRVRPTSNTHRSSHRWPGHLFVYKYDWWFALWVGVPVGLLAAALLQANNLRDIATDTESGKKTLAVRLGRRRAGMFYCFTLLGAALGIGIVSSYGPGRSWRSWRSRWRSSPCGWRWR